MARTKRKNDQFLSAVWLTVFRELENYWILNCGGSPTVLDACQKLLDEKNINFDQSLKVIGEGSKFSMENPETLRDWFYDAEEFRDDKENHWYLWSKTKPLNDRYKDVIFIREIFEHTEKNIKLSVEQATPKKPRGRPATKNRTKTTTKIVDSQLNWKKS